MKTKDYTKVSVVGLLLDNDQGYRARDEENPWLAQATNAINILVKQKGTGTTQSGAGVSRQSDTNRREKRGGEVEEDKDKEDSTGCSMTFPIADRPNLEGRSDICSSGTNSVHRVRAGPGDSTQPSRPAEECIPNPYMGMSCFFCAKLMGENNFCAMNMEFCSIKCREDHYKAGIARGSRAPPPPVSTGSSDDVPYSRFFLEGLIPSDADDDFTMTNAPVSAPQGPIRDSSFNCVTCRGVCPDPPLSFAAEWYCSTGCMPATNTHLPAPGVETMLRFCGECGHVIVGERCNFH